ncbi:MAG: orotate phosphoribosyltransferase, partial [Rhodothermia bacterium]|nr:orotate phosphoribosyltransferase [Rhodothermia bacterium]
MNSATTDSSLSDRLALELIRIGAVVFSPDQPFTWASGIRSPVYCDNRLTMSHPHVRRLIADGFEGVLRREGPRLDVVVGTATAGIPHAAWLAERLNLPMAYVRSSKKSHGRENLIEGKIIPGSQAVVVEDLVSTGGSSLNAVGAVRASGATVDLVLAIFSYNLPGLDAAFHEAGVRLVPLTTFGTLVDVA